MNDFFQNVPYLLITSLNHPLGTFNRIGQPVLFQLANNERLIQFQSYFFRKTTLIEFQIRAYNNPTNASTDDGSTGLLFSWTIKVTYTGGQLAKYLVTLN